VTLYKVTKVKTSWKDLVTGIGIKHLDTVITQIAYLLYKAWIMEINDKRVNYRTFFIHELKEKAEIYTLLGQYDISQILTQIFTAL